jgi:hypothetical protein
VYFQPLVSALTAITSDELGQQALQEGLARIVITNSDQYASPLGFSFSDGVLIIDHKPASNVDDIDDRAQGLQNLLEANL